MGERCRLTGPIGRLKPPSLLSLGVSPESRSPMLMLLSVDMLISLSMLTLASRALEPGCRDEGLQQVNVNFNGMVQCVMSNAGV